MTTKQKVEELKRKLQAKKEAMAKGDRSTVEVDADSSQAEIPNNGNDASMMFDTSV